MDDAAPLSQIRLGGAAVPAASYAPAGRCADLPPHGENGGESTNRPRISPSGASTPSFVRP